MRLKLILVFIPVVSLPFFSPAQAPDPALIGYFQNWQDVNAPYIQLDQVDARYNIVDVAFAVPRLTTDYNMEFVPDQVSQTTFISQIQALQSGGKRALISIGGATAPISLDNSMERDTFIASMSNIINTYGFDGMDIDLEGSSLSLSGGSISNPVDPPVINMINAIKAIMSDHFIHTNHRLILTMAPETVGVQGGQSAYSGGWGSYLPLIDALRDSIEILCVQLYNSGSMYAIDGNIYNQGTADFIVAMTETAIIGFNTSGGPFIGLPANKIAIGLPACSMAAGGGYTDTANVRSAIEYLRGSGPKPGAYTLHNPSGYPTLRGMMTWSINWDKSNACSSNYQYAENYENIFGSTSTTLVMEENISSYSVHPDPATEEIFFNANIDQKSTLRIYNSIGELVLTKEVGEKQTSIDISGLSRGLYFLTCQNYRKKIVKL